MRWRGAGRPGADRPPRRHQLDGAVDARRPAGVGARRARLPAGHADAVEEGGHGAVPARRCAACTPTTAATRPSPARPCSSSPRPAGSSPTPHRPDGHGAARRCCCSPAPGPAGTSRRSWPSSGPWRPAWTTVRADFPYRKEGRRAPDRPPKLLAAVRDELAAIDDDRVVVGGRSMGGRMCSMVAAGADGEPPPAAVAGVRADLAIRCTRRASRTRCASSTCRRSTVPCLFVHGTQDPFGTPDELQRWTATIAGAGHPPLGRRQRPRPQGPRRRGRRRWSRRGWPRSADRGRRVRTAVSVSGPGRCGGRRPDEPADGAHDQRDDDVLHDVEHRLDVLPVVAQDVAGADQRRVPDQPSRSPCTA